MLLSGNPGWYDFYQSDPNSDDPAGIVSLRLEDFSHGASIAQVTLGWEPFDVMDVRSIGVELTPADLYALRDECDRLLRAYADGDLLPEVGDGIERDPYEVYGTPEHEWWLMEMERRGDYQ